MVLAYIFINCEAGNEQSILLNLKKLPEVKEAYLLYGVYDLIVKVETDTTLNLKNVTLKNIRSIPHVKNTMTMLAFPAE